MIESSANKKIITAYLGEVYGISFFQYLSHHHTDEKTRDLWQKLIEVESLTADKLELYLTSKKTPFNREDKQQGLKGENDAKRWVTLPKEALLSTLSSWVAPYEVKYRQWVNDAKSTQVAPIELAALELIAAHETAIYLCLNAEVIEQSGITYLEHFLEKHATVSN